MAKNPQSISLISLGFLLYLFRFTLSDHDSHHKCTKSNTSLLNFTTDFVMVQHQLRGSFKIIDDCSFRVRKFDMLSGGSDVYWWGSVGDSYHNLTSGFVISNDKLNTSIYKNDNFTVELMDNITWDAIKVVSVWKTSMASDFGHVVLKEITEPPPPAPTPDPAPAPSPAPANFTGKSVIKFDGEPTMFDNCKILSDNYRVRWKLRAEENVIDIGLEGTVDVEHYMAFGWADPSSSKKKHHMLGADVAVTGFTDEGVPFVDDYHITKYRECTTDGDGNAEGVCPDTVLNNDSDYDDSVNNTVLVYGHRKDGVSFIRYQRPVISIDKKYDWDVDVEKKMTCIWALGLIKPPDSDIPYYLPENHGKTYGHVHINISENVNDCDGPLDAKDKQDQDLVIADKKTPLVVTSGPALGYPNPPNPDKVLYINKKPSPVLRIERGVPVKFSIQAGHNVAFYVTSDPLGGNATARNESETVYVGGPQAQGVRSKPTELVWAPNRNTPDRVYYQSVFAQKMGWRIQLVDGGLNDMYNNSVLLDDQQVSFFWTLSKRSIAIAARGEKKSGYLAIGFGSEMVKSFVYVGWVDTNGTGHVKSYWINGRNPQGLHPTKEKLSYVRCKSENGVITFEFTRSLDPNCDGHKRVECKNIIEPTSPLKIIWAMGGQWDGENLTKSNMHSSMSIKPVRVSLIRGSAEAEQDLRPVLTVHGFMMFLAWGMFFPSGILAARYMKHLNGNVWFKIHVYSQCSGLTITFLGILFAVAELRGFHFGSVHVKFGVLTLLLGCIQPINAYLRPQKAPDDEQPLPRRIIWEYAHTYTGRLAVLLGIAAIFTGMKHLGDRYGENTRGLTWALIFWVLTSFVTVLYLELNRKKPARERGSGGGNWVLGEDEETDLLSPSKDGENAARFLLSSERREIQLEPLGR